MKSQRFSRTVRFARKLVCLNVLSCSVVPYEGLIVVGEDDVVDGVCNKPPIPLACAM